MEQVSNTPSKAISETTLSETISEPISETISETTPSETISETTPSEFPLLPTSHCNFLRTMSIVTFMGGLYGLKKQQYMMAMCPFVVVFTSLNYWRKPEYGVRRNIDITAVITGVSLYYYTSFKSNQQGMYGTTMCICGGLYGLSWCLYKKGYKWSSTISHSVIYVALTAANALLYNGLSELGL
jgi:hypothetical protein